MRCMRWMALAFMAVAALPMPALGQVTVNSTGDDTPARLTQRFETKDGFSIRLPANWVEISREALDELSRTRHEQMPSIERQVFDYGLEVRRESGGIEAPYVLIQVKRTGKLRESDLIGANAFGEMAEKTQDSLNKSLANSSIRLNSPQATYDKDHDLILVLTPYESNGEVVGESIVGEKLTEEGYISAWSALSEEQFREFGPLVVAIMQNIEPAAHLKYRHEADETERINKSKTELSQLVDAAGTFSIKLPVDWEQIPLSAVQEQFAKACKAISMPETSVCKYAFQLRGAARPFVCPYVMIISDETGRVSERAARGMLLSANESFKRMTSGTKLISNQRMDTPTYDSESHMLRFVTRLDAAKDSHLINVIGTYLTEKGTLSVCCYADEEHYERLHDLFDRIIGSFAVAYDLKYRPASSDSAGIDSSAPLTQKIETHDGFSIYVPADWVQIPKSAIDESVDSVRNAAPNVKTPQYDYGFQLHSGQWFLRPYVLVTVNRQGRVDGYELRRPSISNIPDAMRTGMERNLSKVISEGSVQDLEYDSAHHRILSTMRFSKADGSKVACLIGLVLTQKGFIQVCCYADAAEYASLRPLFVNIISDIAVDEGIRYRTQAFDYVPPYLRRTARVLLWAAVGALAGVLWSLLRKSRKKAAGTGTS